MNKAEIDTTKQKWLVEMLESYMDLPCEAPSEEDKALNHIKYTETIAGSKYIAEVVYPTNGDEFLSIRLIDVVSTKHDIDAEAVVVTASRIATLERNGMDYNVSHETDIRTGTIVMDLSIHDIRAVDKKDADLMMKMFHSIETAVKTGISWVL